MTKKLYAMAFLPFVVFGFNTAVFAADEEIENACIEKADEQNVPDEKYDEFLAKCIEDASKQAKSE